jgi:hypothetical protein
MPLAVVNGQGVQDEPVGLRDCGRRVRIETAAQQDDRLQSCHLVI